MRMKNSDVIRYTMYHQQQVRAANPNPSEQTKMWWRLEDEKNRFLLRYYEEEEAAAEAKAKAKAEAEEDYTFSITSEVKVK